MNFTASLGNCGNFSLQVKQIAGRAGRRGTLYEEGVVTCLQPGDLPLLIDALKQPVELATAAGLFPLFEQVRVQDRSFVLLASEGGGHATAVTALLSICLEFQLCECVLSQ